MAWDSTRTVPWRRLVKEWLIYAAIMCSIVVLFMRDRPLLGIVLGLLASGPLYLLLGYVLAKFGYTRKSWGELRSERPATSTTSATTDAPAPRRKPAPTKRTGGGAQGRRR